MKPRSSLMDDNLRIWCLTAFCWMLLKPGDPPPRTFFRVSKSGRSYCARVRTQTLPWKSLDIVFVRRVDCSVIGGVFFWSNRNPLRGRVGGRARVTVELRVRIWMKLFWKRRSYKKRPHLVLVIVNCPARSIIFWPSVIVETPKFMQRCISCFISHSTQLQEIPWPLVWLVKTMSFQHDMKSPFVCCVFILIQVVFRPALQIIRLHWSPLRFAFFLWPKWSFHVPQQNLVHNRHTIWIIGSGAHRKSGCSTASRFCGRLWEPWSRIYLFWCRIGGGNGCDGSAMAEMTSSW